MVYAAAVVPNPGVAELEEYLKGKGRKTAEDISAATGWDDRTVRRLAASSDLIISSPGREGYKHIAEITMEEYDHYRNARRSQCRKMLGKLIRTDRIYYRRTAAAV